MSFQAACNRIEQPCGCTEWDEWDHLEGGRWVHKSAQCLRHEIAATRKAG